MVIAGVRRELAGVDVQDAGRDRADEMDVVADENERPFVLFERADQGIDRADIEVRRRLIHEQQIGRMEQQLDEREPRFLAAAQDADRFENVVAAKKKRAENRAARFAPEPDSGESSTLSRTVCLTFSISTRCCEK